MNTIEIRTLEGPVRGVVDNGLAVVRGVPFAEPPVGTMRFKAPIPARVRQSARDATMPSPVCPQLSSRLAAVMGELSSEMSEDCLTVTVWAPLPLERSRPILIWFHGGGYLSGGGGLPWYDGSTLARENDIVVVGVNSRLGALGYLFHPGLLDGNLGLFDQIQAVRWIAANASFFGGDPHRITLMGQSGGAHSIACMLAMPKTRTLMQRAILLSTPFALRTYSKEEATSTAQMFCGQLGIDPSQPDALSQLQSASVARILEATGATLRSAKRALGDPTPPFGPVAAGDLPAPDGFDEAVARGSEQIDVMVGSTAGEALGFYSLDPGLAGLTLDALPRIAEGLFGNSWRARLDAAGRVRPGSTALELLSAAQTVHYFAEGIARLAPAVSHGAGAFVYCFEWTPARSRFGACHCVELPFFFGSFDAFSQAPMLGEAVDDKARALSAAIRGAVGLFVKNGRPDGPGLRWPRFVESAPVFLRLNTRLDFGWMGSTA